MNRCRKLYPSRKQSVCSAAILLIVAVAFYYGFQAAPAEVAVTAVIVALCLILPILKMPVEVEETADCIRLKLIVGERKFDKKEYEIEPLAGPHSFTIRLFATSFLLYWGYFWNSTLGRHYALCVNSGRLVLLTDKKTGKKTVIDSPY